MPAQALTIRASIAARLTESGAHRVLLLEAGTEGSSYFWSRVPVGVSKMIDLPAVNWCFASEPDEGSGGCRIEVPRGALTADMLTQAAGAFHAAHHKRYGYSSPNGAVQMDLSGAGSEAVRLHTTNGAVTLTLPESAKATLSASVTNGGISVGEFQNLDVSEKSRRRFEAKLNGGGTPIELQTTNGGVRIRPRNSLAEATDERR